MIKTQEEFFNKIFTSLFIARVQKGCSGFACERELEIEHNCNILTPLLWPSRCVFLVSFLFSWCSTGSLGPTLLDSGFLYCILSASSLDPKLHRGFRGPPRSGVAFPTTSRPSRCVFLVSFPCLSCSLGAQPEAEGPLCWMLAFFTASYQYLLRTPNSIGVPEGPLGRVRLSLPHLDSSCLELYWQLHWPPGRRTQLEPELNSTGSSNSTELYNRSTPTRSLKSNV